jgi:hypothetical protein
MNILVTNQKIWILDSNKSFIKPTNWDKPRLGTKNYKKNDLNIET